MHRSIVEARRARILKRQLRLLPRTSLARLPTPLQPAPRLSTALGVPALHIKRDDLTGLALGGNKTRQLEFLLGDALQQGATAVITGAGTQSNHCRQLAAACAKLGLRACLILRGEQPDRPEGNLLLDSLFGAECRFIPSDRFYGEYEATAAEWWRTLGMQGEHPYVVDTLGWDSPSMGLAALAYVAAALELEEQFDALGWRPHALYLCSGGATQAGLVLAKSLLGLPYRIVGISASPFIPDKPAVIAAVATRAASLLGVEHVVRPEEVTNLDEYIGDGYGALTDSSVLALRLMARTEGVLLDPTYTAKAFGALIDHIKRRLIAQDERVLFLHTGGAPSLFLADNASIAADLVAPAASLV